jgi:hypothetical protein
MSSAQNCCYQGLVPKDQSLSAQYVKNLNTCNLHSANACITNLQVGTLTVRDEVKCDENCVQKSMDLVYLGYCYVDALFAAGMLTVPRVETIGWYADRTLSVGFNALNTTTIPVNPPGFPNTFSAVGNLCCSTLQVTFENVFLGTVFGVTRLKHYYPQATSCNGNVLYVLSRVDCFNQAGALAAILRGSAQYRLNCDHVNNVVNMPTIDWINFFTELPGGCVEPPHDAPCGCDATCVFPMTLPLN